jgi:hypothetical protein
MAEVVEHLPGKHKGLSSITIIIILSFLQLLQEIFKASDIGNKILQGCEIQKTQFLLYIKTR